MRRCYWLTGLTHADCFSCNTGFVVGDKEIVIVDTGNNAEAAATIMEFAKAVAPDCEIQTVVNLEGHYDHVFGNAYFKSRGAKILAHESVKLTQEELQEYIEQCNEEISIPRRRKNQEAYIYFDGVAPFEPDIKVSENLKLDVDGVDLSLYMAPGHTKSNMILFEKTEGVLYAADTIYSGFLPTLGFGDKALWNSWLKALDQIEMLHPEILVPGHGKVLYGEAIKKEINRHRDIIRARIESN